MDPKKIIRKMTLDQRVGQIITFEFVGNRIRDDAFKKIERLQCGGLRITPHVYEAIPYEKRFEKNAPNQQRLACHAHPDYYAGIIHRLQALARKRPMGIPLHISIDQEGDFSCDYARGGVNLAPSAMGVTATGSPALARKVYRAVGAQLRSIGATMVHSPVLDVNFNPKNPEICNRAFSDDPGTVARYALACMRGFISAGICPTAKHFPGRGGSAVDLHYDLDVSRRSLKAYESLDLAPYRTLIAAGLPAIMVSHQICPAFGGIEKPASVSEGIYRYIRKALKFNGVITTDAMGMKGVLARFKSFGHACAEAAAVGADLVLAKCNPELEQDVFDWIKRYVDSGRIPETVLDAKVERILAMKIRQGLFRGYFDPQKAARTLARPSVRTPIRAAAEKSIILVRDEARLIPLSPRRKVLVIEPFYREWQNKGLDNFYQPGMLSLFMQAYSRNVRYLETDIAVSREDERRALAMASECDITVVNSFFWRSCPTNAGLVKKLIQRRRRVIVVANTPYKNICLPEVKTLIVNWAQVPFCQKAAADLLFGKRRGAGKWPLKKYRIRGIK
jgi:beta-N-acetylhexosaminidase